MAKRLSIALAIVVVAWWIGLLSREQTADTQAHTPASATVIPGVPPLPASPDLTTPEPVPVERFVPNVLLVDFGESAPRAEIEARLQTLGMSVTRMFPRSGIYQIEHPAHLTAQRATVMIERTFPGSHVERDRIVRLFRLPNDPDLASQWALHTADSPDIGDADIDMDPAWDISTGSREVAIMVLDSGVDIEHEDLRENLWRNPNEVPFNGVDDDGNGFVDDVFGFDGITPPTMDDPNGHGTHVAGTIAAVGDNATGVAGVMWQAQVVACRAFDGSGSGSFSAILLCFEYAEVLKERGVNLVAVNHSWGFNGPESQFLTNAISRHNDMGILNVAAAGNSGHDNDTNPTYPANTDLPNVISVAAHDEYGDLAFFSNYGEQNVHLAAPGVRVLSTFPANRYAAISGTSMAAPHVVGVIGLIASANPALSAAELRDAVLAGVVRDSRYSGVVASGGRLSVSLPFLDLDGDGMADAWETDQSLNPSDPADAAQDPDGDGLTNLQEFRLRTDPNVADTDGDGLSDGVEVNTTGTSPLDADTDNDGLSDGQEANANTDPFLADSDGDGLNDGAEVDAGTDPLNNDSDGDGLSDGWEAANGLDPNAAGDEGSDADGDGLNAAAEFAEGTDPNDADSDDDGLTDGDEVQNHLTNPTQADTDTDGMPDGWEVANGLNPLVDDAGEDADGDGKSNRIEYAAGSDPNDATSLPPESFSSARQGPARTGFAPFATRDSALRTRWVMDIDAIDGFPVMADDRIYLNFWGGQAGYAEFDGAQALQLPIGEQARPIQLVSGDAVVVALIQDSSSALDDRVIGVDAITGALLWERDTRRIEGEMVVFGGRLFSPEDDELIVRDVRTDAEIWRATIPGRDPDLRSSYGIIPAVSDAFVAVFAGQTLTVYNPDTGAVISSAQVSTCGPDTRPWTAIDNNGGVVIDYKTCMAYVDAQTGTVNWDVEVRPFEIEIAPTVDSSRVYYLSPVPGYQLVALDKQSGLELWRHPLPNFANPQPEGNLFATLDHIFVPSFNGTYGFDIASQTFAWWHPVGGTVSIGANRTLALFDQGVLSIVDLAENLDEDEDGLPAYWERRYGLSDANPADAALDADSDGLDNLFEFTNESDPTSNDTDQDGVTDDAEVARATALARADTDGDGLSDGAEVNQGTSPLRVDTDADGALDQEEDAAGTNPTDPLDKPVRTAWFDESFEAGVPADWVASSQNENDWWVDTTASHGRGSLRTPDGLSLQRATLSFSSEFEAGELSFDAMVSTDVCCDSLLVSVDGEVQIIVDRERWQRYVVQVPAGERTIEFEYIANDEQAFAPDFARIDNVRFRPAVAPGGLAGRILTSANGWVVDFDADGRQLSGLRNLTENRFVQEMEMLGDEHQLVLMTSTYLYFLDIANGTVRDKRLPWLGSGSDMAVGEHGIYITHLDGIAGIRRFDARGNFIASKFNGALFYSVAIGPNGDVYVQSDEEGQLQILDPITLQTKGALDLDCNLCRGLAFTPQGNPIMVDGAGRLLVFNMDGTLLRTVDVGDAFLIGVDALENGSYAIAGFGAEWGVVSDDFARAQVFDVPKPLYTSVAVGTLHRRGRDTDDDGLPDWWEQRYGYDPLQADDAFEDRDGDGLDALAEYDAGSEPHRADSDGDGLLDGAEVDGGSSPIRADTDDDGLFDADELAGGTQPTNADSDGDGIDDGEEQLWGTDALVADSDGDGLEDGWEVANGMEPTDQADATADVDGDGLNAVEERAAGTDLNLADTDGDGLRDGEELTLYGTDPTLRDSDGDGMDDQWEVAQQLSPTVADGDQDTDADGFSNLLEFYSDTNPLDANAFPTSRIWGSANGGQYHRGYVPVALDITAFEERWSLDLTERFQELLPVATGNGQVFSVHREDAEYVVSAFNSSTGVLSWSRLLEDTSIVSPPAFDGTSVYLQTSLPGALVSIDAGNGSVNYNRPFDDGITGPTAPMVFGNDVILPADGRLRNFAADTGNMRWEYSGIGRSDGFAPVVDGNALYMFSSENEGSVIGVDRPSGAVRFVRPSADTRFWPFTDGSPVLSRRNSLFSAHNGVLQAFDLHRLESSWSRQGQYLDQVSYGQGKLYTILDGDLVVYDASTGQELWRWSTTSSIVYPALVTLNHVVVSTDFRTYVIDLTSRSAVWDIARAGAPALGNDGVLVLAGRFGELTVIQTERDTDGDGLPDPWEERYGLNPNSSSDASMDPDGDGLSNTEEFRLRTDPTRADTDDDGLSDGEEANTYGTRPIAPDSDADGLSDGEEVNTYGTDPLREDTDGDALNDGDETQRQTNPLSGDSDADGFNDGWEVQQGTNPLDAASVPGAVGAIIESFEEPLNARWNVPADAQVAWTRESFDRSQGVYSLITANQFANEVAAIEWEENFDEVTLSFDAWRSTRFPSNRYEFLVDGVVVHDIEAFAPRTYEVTLDEGVHVLRWQFRKGNDTVYLQDKAKLDYLRTVPVDSDGDGMGNSWERRYKFDPDDASDEAEDADGDALSNADEYAQGTLPDTPDTDSDGMPDGWEVQYSLMPTLADGGEDADGDGATNLEEYNADTDPRDRNSTPGSGGGSGGGGSGGGGSGGGGSGGGGTGGGGSGGGGSGGGGSGGGSSGGGSSGGGGGGGGGSGGALLFALVGLLLFGRRNKPFA